MLDSIPSRNVKGDIQLYHFPMPGLPMDAQSFANISFFAIPCSVEARTRFEYLILEDATICDVLRTSNVVHLFRFSTIPESLSIDAKKRENSSTGSAPITFLSFDVSFLQGNHFFQLAIGHIGQGGVVSTRICQIRHQLPLFGEIGKHAVDLLGQSSNPPPELLESLCSCSLLTSATSDNNEFLLTIGDSYVFVKLLFIDVVMMGH